MTVEFAPWETPVQYDQLNYYRAFGHNSRLPIEVWRVARMLPRPIGRHKLEVDYLSRNKLAAVEFRFDDHIDVRRLDAGEFAELRKLMREATGRSASTFKVRGHTRPIPTHELWKQAFRSDEYSYIIADVFGGGHEIVSGSEPVVTIRPVDLLAFDGWPGVVVREGPRTDAHELCGLDCVWLACDMMGQVAAMITAGQGPVPASAVSAPVDVLELENRLNQLEVNGSVHVRAGHSGGYDEFSERGLYVYDWTDAVYFDSLRHRPPLHAYEAMTAPSSPLLVPDLPGDLRQVAELTRFDVEFRHASVLPVRPAEAPPQGRV